VPLPPPASPAMSTPAPTIPDMKATIPDMQVASSIPSPASTAPTETVASTAPPPVPPSPPKPAPIANATPSNTPTNMLPLLASASPKPANKLPYGGIMPPPNLQAQSMAMALA